MRPVAIAILILLLVNDVYSAFTQALEKVGKFPDGMAAKLWASYAIFFNTVMSSLSGLTTPINIIILVVAFGMLRFSRKRITIAKEPINRV